MSNDKPSDSTRQLIADADALRGEAPRGGADGKGKPRPPSTRQIVRDAEKLLGRPTALSPALSMLKMAILMAALALAIGAAYFLWGH